MADTTSIKGMNWRTRRRITMALMLALMAPFLFSNLLFTSPGKSFECQKDLFLQRAYFENLLTNHTVEDAMAIFFSISDFERRSRELGKLRLSHSEVTTEMRLPLCPEKPKETVLTHLISGGPLKIDLTTIPSLPDQALTHAELGQDGRYQPSDCRARFKVAILVPFRDRTSHLEIFLHHIHPFLQRQKVDYTIFVIEQEPSTRFNRGTLLNVGVLESLKVNSFDCFILHDVDLIPEDDRNLYHCFEQPKHMAAAISKFEYKLAYDGYFGGVVSIKAEQFKKINGFSNDFWGWGGEDDDFFKRVKRKNLSIIRDPPEISRYLMLKHEQASVNPIRYNLLFRDREISETSGINSVNYNILDKKHMRICTWMLVRLEEPQKPPEDTPMDISQYIEPKKPPKKPKRRKKSIKPLGILA